MNVALGFDMFTEHKTIVDGLEVYYRTVGNATKQHLVFLHGWGARSKGPLGSNKVILELSKYFYIVAPEHPGLVRSTPPQEIWGFDEFAHSLHKLLRPLNLQHPIVMGQSFGGGVASAYAKLYPEEIRTLILVDSVTNRRTYNLYRKCFKLWCQLFLFLTASRWSPYN